MNPGLTNSVTWSRKTTRLATIDRKSTRLNSSHGYISYAVFCLKKKKTTHTYPAHPNKNHNTLSNNRTATPTDNPASHPFIAHLTYEHISPTHITRLSSLTTAP